MQQSPRDKTGLLSARPLVQCRKAILDLKKKLRGGESIALGNIAATYRELGNSRRAFYWWRKAASQLDGDAYVEVGYCFHYRVGVRKNVRTAIAYYRKALAAYYITEYAREEAQYHLAVALLDSGIHRSSQRVRKLLQQAAEDRDFAQAMDLLEQLGSKEPLRVCRCRRGLLRRFGGKTHCTLHR